MDLGSEQTHYRGLLAGVGAGAMTVLVAVPLLFWMVHRQIAGPVGIAMIAVVASVAFVAASVALYVAGFLLLRMRVHVREPETVMGRITLRAKPAPAAQSMIPSPGVKELPAPGSHVHYHFGSPEEAAEVFRGERDELR